MASKKESPLGRLIKKMGVKDIAPAQPKKKMPKAYRHHSGDEKLASWMDEIYIPSGRPLFPLVPKAKPKVKAKAKAKAGKAQFYGFKFLRLREDALEQLKLIDGSEAPRVTGPKGILSKFPPHLNRE